MESKIDFPSLIAQTIYRWNYPNENETFFSNTQLQLKKPGKNPLFLVFPKKELEKSRRAWGEELYYIEKHVALLLSSPNHFQFMVVPA